MLHGATKDRDAQALTADQADQLFALRPVVAPRIAAAGVEVEPAEDRGIFRGQVFGFPI